MTSHQATRWLEAGVADGAEALWTFKQCNQGGRRNRMHGPLYCFLFLLRVCLLAVLFVGHGAAQDFALPKPEAKPSNTVLGQQVPNRNPAQATRSSLAIAEDTECSKLLDVVWSSPAYSDMPLKQRAIVACRDALKQHPSNVVLAHWLGKSYQINFRYRDALDMWEQAARAGYTHAIYDLGVLYYIGEGTAPNRNYACRLIREAASLGHNFAQRQLARGVCNA